ncbi:ATP-binding protein [Parafrigoribacterium soli]|uniref:ATP-binding protein n=1 Tax=Parafrigoribacterium soli TaxID=3144663 RepID=UPI0032EC785F
MTGELRVNIRPEVNILSVLRHLNYKPWFALAEFVDNSLQSYLDSNLAVQGIPLAVAIDFEAEGAGRIVVTDNAAGILLSDFPRAFRAADVPPNTNGLSEFGMGMKSAASWFAKTWRVRTSVAGEGVERSVTFDITSITQNHTEQLDVIEASAPIDAHYTVIELNGLNHIPQTQTVNKIKSHLTSIYRTYIRDERMTLSFRGEQLQYAEVEPLSAPRAAEPDGVVESWWKPIEFSLTGGQTVVGFAGIRAVGSTSQAGFALLRRGRLILGSYDEPYRPVEIFGRSNTYTYQRLYGELTLDGFEVSHTKDGFRWEEEEEEFLALLELQIRAEPLNLFAQASGYRAKTADLITPIENAATNVAAAVEAHFVEVLGNALVPIVDSMIPDQVSEAAGRTIKRQIEVKIDSANWLIEIEATVDAPQGDWLEVGANVDEKGPDGKPRTRVSAKVNLSHPFSTKFLGPSNENSELMIALASAVALSLALGKQVAAKSYKILRDLNVLLRDTFAVITGQEEQR